jgi:hypothetical protein
MPETFDPAAIPQLYQTVLFPPETSLGVTFITVPVRSFQDPSILSNSHLIRRNLDVEPIATVDPENLLSVVSEYLAAVSEGSESLFLRPFQETSLRHPHLAADRYMQTARKLIDTPVIPFEQSPLTAESLGKLATRASGAGLGAYIGFVLAGSSPWLLLTIPVGIVLMSAAVGTGKGLEKGLEKRIEGLIAGPRTRSRSRR